MPASRGRASPLDLNVSHLSWAVCRVLYHSAVFWVVFDLWRWQGVAFAGDREAAAVLLPTAMMTNAAIVVGLWTRAFLVANAVLLRAVFALCLDSYTADEVIENVSLLFALAPAPRALSIDSLRRGAVRPWPPVPRWFVWLVFTAAGLIYADGLRYKLASEVWRRGSAFWLGASLPHFSTGLFPSWAEHEALMRLCTYGALAYEAFFPLILVRPLRPLWAGLGLLVHVGSGVLMALPQFALLMTGLISFFVPWERLAHGAGAAVPTASPDAPHSSRPAALVAYVLVALMLAGQLSLQLHPQRPRSLLCRLLGLYPRAIFIDWHFLLPGPLIRLTAVAHGREMPIPSFDREGYPTLHDRYWKLFGFTLRASGRWQEPVLRYARDWFERSDLPAAEIRVYCRDARLTSLGLDFAQDDEHRRRSWVPCGRFELKRPGAAPRPISSLAPPGWRRPRGRRLG